MLMATTRDGAATTRTVGRGSTGGGGSTTVQRASYDHRVLPPLSNQTSLVRYFVNRAPRL